MTFNMGLTHLGSEASIYKYTKHHNKEIRNNVLLCVLTNEFIDNQIMREVP